jgi:hypothetical protein
MILAAGAIRRAPHVLDNVSRIYIVSPGCHVYFLGNKAITTQLSCKKVTCRLPLALNDCEG